MKFKRSKRETLCLTDQSKRPRPLRILSSILFTFPSGLLVSRYNCGHCCSSLWNSSGWDEGSGAGGSGRAPDGPPGPLYPLLHVVSALRRWNKQLFVLMQTRWAFCFYSSGQKHWSHMKSNLCRALVYSRWWPFVCKQTNRHEMTNWRVWFSWLLTPGPCLLRLYSMLFLMLIQILLFMLWCFNNPNFWMTQPLFCKLVSSCIWVVALSSLLTPSHTSLFPHKPHYLWMWRMALIIDSVYFLKFFILNALQLFAAESAPVRYKQHMHKFLRFEDGLPWRSF